MFDYVTIGFGFLSLAFTRNSIEIGFREVDTKMIKTKNKWKTSDPSDPSNCKNSAITLDPMSHDPSN